MSSLFKKCPLCLLLLSLLIAACQTKVEHNTQELVDPWLRDATLVSLRLAGQVGPSVISLDWRDDTKGSISLNLIVNAIDLKAVIVEEITVKTQGSYAPTASVSVGDTIDLSSGTGTIVLTAPNGEQRTYYISYSSTELFGGTFSFKALKSALGWGDATYCYFAGGLNADVRTGNIYDHLGKAWQKDANHWPNDELDNILSFKQTYFDSEKMVQYGSFLNLAGEDGLWADFVYTEEFADASIFTKDCNSIYRLIPAGKARWSNKIGSDTFVFYAYSDDTYSTPIAEATILYQGTHNIEYAGANVASWCPQAISVSDAAFTRVYSYDSYTDHGDQIATYVADNVRQVWWLMNKDSDKCLDNHDELIATTPSL